MPASPVAASAAPRHDLHVMRDLAAVRLEQCLARRSRATLDELQLEERRRLR